MTDQDTHRRSEAARRFTSRDAWTAGRLFFEAEIGKASRAPDAHAHLGFFCVKESRFDTARGLAEFDTALSIDPRCGLAYLYRAITLGSLRRTAEATAALAEAAARGASPENLLWAKGSVALESGDAPTAADYFDRLVSLSRNATNMILLSQAQSQAGRQAEAVEWARKAASSDPDDFRAPVYEAIALWHLGCRDDARTALSRSLVNGDHYPLAHHTLAVIARAEGDSASAERHARACLERDPDYVTARNLLGDLCLATGRGAEAADQYRKALALFPDYAEARASLRLIGEKGGA